MNFNIIASHTASVVSSFFYRDLALPVHRHRALPEHSRAERRVRAPFILIQLLRRVFIGSCLCSRRGSSHERFLQESSAFPKARRCFALEPSDEQVGRSTRSFQMLSDLGRTLNMTGGTTCEILVGALMGLRAARSQDKLVVSAAFSFLPARSSGRQLSAGGVNVLQSMIALTSLEPGQIQGHLQAILVDFATIMLHDIQREIQVGRTTSGK